MINTSFNGAARALAALAGALLFSACSSGGGSSTSGAGSPGGAGGAGGSSSNTGGSGAGGPAVCGNGVVDQGEECDDGNAAGDDACAPTCTKKVNFITKSYPAADDDFANPERGFYSQVDLEDGATEAAGIRALGLTLAYAPVRLDDYRDKSLDAKLFASLKAGFSAVRTAGIKVILRFTYNDGFDPDAPKDRVIEHIGQLSPLLVENADVIAVMQAGFIGAWGEWHASTNGLETTANRKDILLGILASLPPSRAVQIRTPMYKDAIFPGGPMTEKEAFGGSDKARTGHHNDCFLASADDQGTYEDPVATWKAYVGDDGRFLPIGGETCGVDKPRSDCPTALAELEALHFSFVNSLYHPDVLSGWESQGCMEEIKQRLGYRITLDSAAWSERVAPGGALGVEVTLHNRGFAAMYNQRPLYIVLGEGTDRRAALLPAIDPRSWEPGEPVTIKAWLRVPSNLAAGSYRLSLWLPDGAETLKGKPDYAVRLANADVWEASSSENILTSSLSIDPSAAGSVAAGASDFVEIK